jgi:hypothetical protein
VCVCVSCVGLCPCRGESRCNEAATSRRTLCVRKIVTMVKICVQKCSVESGIFEIWVARSGLTFATIGFLLYFLVGSKDEVPESIDPAEIVRKVTGRG